MENPLDIPNFLVAACSLGATAAAAVAAVWSTKAANRSAKSAENMEIFTREQVKLLERQTKIQEEAHIANIREIEHGQIYRLFVNKKGDALNTEFDLAVKAGHHPRQLVDIIRSVLEARHKDDGDLYHRKLKKFTDHVDGSGVLKTESD